MSAKVVKLLVEKKLSICGTACAGKKDWPKELSKHKQLTLKHAESRVVM
jgi:hypothetical protein